MTKWEELASVLKSYDSMEMKLTSSDRLIVITSITAALEDVPGFDKDRFMNILLGKDE